MVVDEGVVGFRQRCPRNTDKLRRAASIAWPEEVSSMLVPKFIHAHSPTSSTRYGLPAK